MFLELVLWLVATAFVAVPLDIRLSRSGGIPPLCVWVLLLWFPARMVYAGLVGDTAYALNFAAVCGAVAAWYQAQGQLEQTVLAGGVMVGVGLVVVGGKR